MLRALASKTPELATSLIEAGAAASLTDSLAMERAGSARRSPRRPWGS